MDDRRSKLTNANLLDIRALILEREELKERLRSLTNHAIAKRFSVHHRTIEKLVQGHSYKARCELAGIEWPEHHLNRANEYADKRFKDTNRLIQMWR